MKYILLSTIALFFVLNHAHTQVLVSDFVKDQLIYQNTLGTQEAVKDWKMEGPGVVVFSDGWMRMYSPKEKFHHVFWCPNDFPESFVAEWEAQNLKTDAGLCIIFFATKGAKGESIFYSSFPKRDGTFTQNTKSNLFNF